MRGGDDMNTMDAERSVIGAVLQDPARLAELHDLQPRHFHGDQLGKLWGILQTMRGGIDLVTVTERAIAEGLPVHVVLECNAPASANARHYAGIVREHCAAREARQVLSDAMEKIGKRPTWEVFADLEIKAQRITSEAGASSDSYADVWDAWADDLSEDRGVGLSWGLPTLDRELGPIKRGKLIVIAARPGMGKSALAQQVAEAIAEQCVGVVYGQTEMSAGEMLSRSVSRRAMISGRRFARAELTAEDWEKIHDTRATLERLPLYVVDRPGLTCAALRNEALRRGAGAVVVDYLQRLSGPERTEYERVSAISAQLKDMTRGGGPTVIALAQLSRQLEMRYDKMPIASDLRSSGQIEQDADLIVGLTRPAVYDEDADDTEAQIGIIKHREGVPGRRISLHWRGAYTSFAEVGAELALD